MPSHYLNQCWDIVNWTLRKKLQWNINRNSNSFIQENAFENVVCEMAAILPRPQWVKSNDTMETINPTSMIICWEKTWHWLHWSYSPVTIFSQYFTHLKPSSVKIRINSLAPGRCCCNLKFVIFKLISRIDISKISFEIALRSAASGERQMTSLMISQYNIGSGNGLVPSGNKPLSEPMLTQIYAAIWCH